MATEGWLEQGSDNVFADLGLPNPAERLTKADLAMRVGDRIRAGGLTPEDIALLMDLEPTQVGRLLVGQISGFSTHQLQRLLAAMG